MCVLCIKEIDCSLIYKIKLGLVHEDMNVFQLES